MKKKREQNAFNNDLKFDFWYSFQIMYTKMETVEKILVISNN